MKPTELVVLLPCHSLEDFPTYHTGDAAEGLLAAWSALWHPALLAAALKTPTWRRADDPPAPVEGMLIVVPTVIEHELPTDFAQRAAAAGAVIIQGLHRRREIVTKALEALSGPQSSPPSEPLAAPSDELVSDFLALGLIYLLTELLTRRMRYMSNLDETAFQDNVLSAATAAVAGDEETARQRIGRSCEALYEARAHYYPVDTYLVDLTLVADTTLGESLRRELAGGMPINLLATGEVIEQMAQREQASLDLVRERLAAKTLALVGGEYREAELPLLSLEAMLAELEAGQRAYEKHLGARPEVFGRRRAGLTPALPQVLRGLGYKGALHFTLDDGRFPQSDRSKTLWEGDGATAIDAVGRVPLDAGEAGSVLSLPVKLGESMDHDFVSMITLAHWPGGASEYYDDLRRISKYSPVLGKFITVEEFFASTETAGTFSKFKHDEYRAPYLKQAVSNGEADPLSSYAPSREQEQRREDAATLEAWAVLLAGKATTTAIADAIAPPAHSDAAKGVLLANVLNSPRRVTVDISSLAAPPDEVPPVLAIDGDATPAQALVEVPALGFAWVGPGTGKSKKGKHTRPIARDHTLVNELCEVTIHSETGGIRSIRDLHARGNRLSQQLAMRLGNSAPMPAGLWRDADEGAKYSQMVADTVEITSNSSVSGEITSRGRLVDAGGRTLAKFMQATRLPAGRAAIEFDIELQPNEEPTADPWLSYYACRFAWSDDLAEFHRSVHRASVATEAKRLEAPDFIEIVGAKSRTAILTGGLPYHLRVGPRMLDSLLIVRGETARRFRMGIALEHAQPWEAAWELTGPSPVAPGMCAAPAGARFGWLFHLDRKQVTATHWQPLIENGLVSGFQVRLLEAGGSAGRVTLRMFRDIASAHRVTLGGERVEELTVEADRIRVEIGAYEWLQLEARWA